MLIRSILWIEVKNSKDEHTWSLAPESRIQYLARANELKVLHIIPEESATCGELVIKVETEALLLELAEGIKLTCWSKPINWSYCALEMFVLVLLNETAIEFPNAWSVSEV